MRVHGIGCCIIRISCKWRSIISVLLLLFRPTYVVRLLVSLFFVHWPRLRLRAGRRCMQAQSEGARRGCGKLVKAGRKGRVYFFHILWRRTQSVSLFFLLFIFLRKFLKATNPRHVYCRNYLYTYIMLFFSLFFPRNFPTPPPPPSLPPLPLPLNRKIQRER